MEGFGKKIRDERRKTNNVEMKNRTHLAVEKEPQTKMMIIEGIELFEKSSVENEGGRLGERSDKRNEREDNFRGEISKMG